MALERCSNLCSNHHLWVDLFWHIFTVPVGQLADLLVKTSSKHTCSTRVPGIMIHMESVRQFGMGWRHSGKFLGGAAKFSLLDLYRWWIKWSNPLAGSLKYLNLFNVLHWFPQVLDLLAELEATLAQPNVISYRCLADLPRLVAKQSW